MQAVFGVRHVLPGLDAGPVGAVVVRLQPLPAGQLDVRDDEVQFEPVFVAVLDPHAVVLVGFEAGHQRRLEAVHDLGLGGVGKVALGERQNAGRVPLRVWAGVDQPGGLIGVAAQQGRAFAVALTAEKVLSRPRAAAYAASVKLDDHSAASG